MKQEIIEKTYELVDEIKASKDYLKLVSLKERLDSDEEVLELISRFNKQKLKYEEVVKYGKYHPDLKKVQISFAKAKENLYTNSIVKEYKELENRVQKTLDEISIKLATSISAKIKHPNEIGLINKK